jgi:hypothetical protein
MNPIIRSSLVGLMIAGGAFIWGDGDGFSMGKFLDAPIRLLLIIRRPNANALDIGHLAVKSTNFYSKKNTLLLTRHSK